jgi:hypothetical protein
MNLNNILGFKIVANQKLLIYQFVDRVKIYNFDIKFIFIQFHMEKILNYFLMQLYLEVGLLK